MICLIVIVCHHTSNAISKQRCSSQGPQAMLQHIAVPAWCLLSASIGCFRWAVLCLHFEELGFVTPSMYLADIACNICQMSL